VKNSLITNRILGLRKKGVKMNNQKDTLLFNKRVALIICFIIFIIANVILIIINIDSYAFDEFYHIGSANLSFDTDYKRAIYINYLVKLFSQVFGGSYYTIRLIPLIVGLISFVCLLFLVSKLCESTLCIYISAFIMTFHSLFMFNHIYIRLYVFQELSYMVGALFLYFYSVHKEKYRIVYLILFELTMTLYAVFTNDSSAIAMLAIGITVGILIYFHKFKLKYHILFPLSVICLLIVFCIKNNYIYFKDNYIFDGIYDFLTFYINKDIPVFLLFLLFAYTIPLWSILRFPGFNITSEKREQLYPLWLLAFLPLLAYAILFYDNNLLRTFTPYMGAGVIICCVYIDHIKQNRSKLLIVIFIILGNICLSYPEINIKNFWGEPSIKDETYLKYYGDLLNDLRLAEEEGYQIVTVLGMIQEEKYFNITPTISLTKVGDNNRIIVSERKFRFNLNKILLENSKITIIGERKFRNNFDKILLENSRIAIVVDQLGTDRLIEYDYYDLLINQFKYVEYDGFMYIFFIN